MKKISLLILLLMILSEINIYADSILDIVFKKGDMGYSSSNSYLITWEKKDETPVLYYTIGIEKEIKRIRKHKIEGIINNKVTEVFWLIFEPNKYKVGEIIEGVFKFPSNPKTLRFTTYD